MISTKYLLCIRVLTFHNVFSGYVTCILDDSRIYANHAKKKFIDLDDVRLAVKMQLERAFTNPPPRDVLLEVARAKNNIPLPFVRPTNGLRLPPDRYCLNSANYRLKNITRKPAVKSLLGNSTNAKPAMSIVKRPANVSTVAKTQTITMSKPQTFKLTTGIKENYSWLFSIVFYDINFFFFFCYQQVMAAWTKLNWEASQKFRWLQISLLIQRSKWKSQVQNGSEKTTTMMCRNVVRKLIESFKRLELIIRGYSLIWRKDDCNK